MKNDWKKVFEVYEFGKKTYPHVVNIKLSILEEIINQVQYDQKEEDAQITEVMKEDGSIMSYDFSEDFSIGYNQACDDIAKAIRGK